MSTRVLKYLVPVDDLTHTIEMPLGATIVHVHAEPAAMVSFWVVADQEQETEYRTFTIAGTGQPLDGADHRGTTVHTASGLVWHLFETYPDLTRQSP